MNYSEIFAEIYKEIKKVPDLGQVASYIPELANVNPNKFGVHLTTVEEEHFGFGDEDEKFSIQSVSKVLSLVLAYQLEGEKLWKRVGVEPSGTAFNSLFQLEQDNGIPRNPFMNSGALVVCDILVSYLKNPKEDFLAFIRNISNNDGIDYNIKVAESERSTGYRNGALINLMKSFDNIKNDVHKVMDFYFYLCSLEMTCKELSSIFLFLAKGGFNPHTNERVITVSKAKRINAVMQLCGFYDEAGEFAFKVGLPGKSGVGGGIIALHPSKYCIAVWSPRLNKKGNSNLGIQFLERFTTAIETSIF